MATTVIKSDAEPTNQHNLEHASTDTEGTIKTNNSTYIVLDDRCNVIDDYIWTVKEGIPPKYLEQVPYIELTEYQPTGNQFLDSYASSYKAVRSVLHNKVDGVSVANKISNLVGTFSDKFRDGSVAEQLLKDVSFCASGLASYMEDVKHDSALNYQKLYKGKSTGNIYKLPFISTFNANITNDWGGDVGGLSSKFNETLVNVGSITGGSGVFGAGIGAVDRMKIWGPGSPQTYTFSFQLHNTMVDGSADDKRKMFTKNYNLIRALKYNNLPDRLSGNVLLQPVIYKVSIPGIHYSPASALTNINIESVGQKNIISLPINMDVGDDGIIKESPLADMTEVEVPDAYTITITVTDLYVETRDLYFGAFSDDGKVDVMLPDDNKKSVANAVSIKGV